jgi:hypothetical protein
LAFGRVTIWLRNVHVFTSSDLKKGWSKDPL